MSPFYCYDSVRTLGRVGLKYGLGLIAAMGLIEVLCVDLDLYNYVSVDMPIDSTARLATSCLKKRGQHTSSWQSITSNMDPTKRLKPTLKSAPSMNR